MGSPSEPAILCECGCQTFHIYHLMHGSVSVTVGVGIEGEFLLVCSNCAKEVVIGMRSTFEVSGEVYSANWGRDRPKMPTEK